MIRAHEEGYLRRAIAAWTADPALEVLGNTEAERLSIVSFVVRRPGGRYLHHNFVVALLNDLFGIQARGGCSCAGPYGHRLLGIDLERSHEFEREIAHGCEGIKPGWVRVNFNYFISEQAFRYVVNAVSLVAAEGWKLLPDYRFEPATGLWVHRLGPVEPPLRLDQVGYDAHGVLTYPRRHDTAPESVLAEHLAEARTRFAAAVPWVPSDEVAGPDAAPPVSAAFEDAALVRPPRRVPDLSRRGAAEHARDARRVGYLPPVPDVTEPLPAALVEGLVHDTAALSGDRALRDVVAAHERAAAAPYGAVLGPLVVAASQAEELRTLADPDGLLLVALVADQGLLALQEARHALQDDAWLVLDHVRIPLPPGFPAAEAARALLAELAFTVPSFVELPAPATRTRSTCWPRTASSRPPTAAARPTAVPRRVRASWPPSCTRASTAAWRSRCPTASTTRCAGPGPRASASAPSTCSRPSRPPGAARPPPRSRTCSRSPTPRRCSTSCAASRRPRCVPRSAGSARPRRHRGARRAGRGGRGPPRSGLSPTAPPAQAAADAVSCSRADTGRRGADRTAVHQHHARNGTR